MTAPPIKVLIVDDSVTIRRVIRSALLADGDIEVVGAIGDGKAGLAAVKKLRPDVITLDLEMPGVDGLTMLRELRTTRPDLPVVVVSGAADENKVVDAMAAGASEVLRKPSYDEDPRWVQLRAALVKHVRTLGRAHIAGRESLRAPPPTTGILSGAGLEVDRSWRAVVVASSTGGPEALTQLFAEVPEDFPLPILLVQHMPDGFTPYLATRLGRAARIPVAAAEDGEKVVAGRVYLAPAGQHMSVRKDVLGLSISLDGKSPPVVGCRPAADVLFSSAAAVYGPRVAGVVLTGMGNDGLAGCRALKKRNAVVFAQDVDTSVVWGMPGQVVNAKLADLVGGPDWIGKTLVKRVERQAQTSTAPLLNLPEVVTDGRNG